MPARTVARTTQVGDFLRARRDALQPEDVGLAREPGRRVPGLRREEVAQLADISPEYYLRLEQGRDHQPSEQVLAALCRALRLDPAAADYLYRLVHPFRRRLVPTPRPGSTDDGDLVAVVGAFQNPAIVVDRTKDVVAVNGLAAAMAAHWCRPGHNLVLASFAPQVRRQLPDWARHARRMVASLRLSADPDDPRLQEIVGRLSLQDEDFQRWWASHEVSAVTHGTVPMTIDGHGDVVLQWHELDLPDHPGHVVTMFSAIDDAGRRGLDLVRSRAGASRGRGRCDRSDVLVATG